MKQKNINGNNDFYVIPKRFIDKRIKANQTFTENTERGGNAD